MDKRKISEEVYERYVDASVALFMEYYAASCLDEPMEPRADETDFPAELDTRCRALISREFARQRRKTFFKAATKGLGVVACLAAVILSLSSVLFMTVEAVRVPIINYYIQEQDGYWEISGSSKNGEEMHNDYAFDISNPLANIIPEKYIPVSVAGESLEWLNVLYQSSDNHEIHFSSRKMSKLLKVDSEDVQFSHSIQILGGDAVIVVKDNSVQLAWLCESTGTTFSLFSTEYDETEIIAFAEKLTIAFCN